MYLDYLPACRQILDAIRWAMSPTGQCSAIEALTPANKKIVEFWRAVDALAPANEDRGTAAARSWWCHALGRVAAAHAVDAIGETLQPRTRSWDCCRWYPVTRCQLYCRNSGRDIKNLKGWYIDGCLRTKRYVLPWYGQRHQWSSPRGYVRPNQGREGTSAKFTWDMADPTADNA